MLTSLKKFLKVYPLPIFVLLLSFVIYYSAFEIIRKRELHSVEPKTEVDSMLNESNQVVTNAIEPLESNTTPMIPQEPEIPLTQEPKDEPIQTQMPKIYLVSNTPSLNIRQEPSTNAAIVGKLTPAIQVILLEEKGEWIFIANAESEKPLGWIMKRFTQEITPLAQIQTNQPQQPLATPTPTATPKTYITSNVSSLNIRQEPDTSSTIIGKLTPSHKAVLLEEKGEWILIGTFEDGKVLGWILKSLSHELPQEIKISESRDFIPSQRESQTTLTPMELESQNNQTQQQQPQMSETKQETPPLAQDTPLYTSRVASLNIRELPSTDTPVVGKLTPDDSVIIVETQDIWVRILDANTPSIKNGWVVRRSLVPRQ
ncbi:SH3 domain-containing protein [Helicobacter sp.]|uniref:SH3 domain-containing protein n=1 Tax=Helicobacter sp. TaxID=218 RepID=UPI0019A43FC2|nr:SH3 domain-containing protein [Helicobacter sp.]MBD5165778.1 SH3 domain-containing protein [Helicobacter sp.]